MNATWLGNIPSNWQVRRLGTLGRLQKGSGGSKEDNCDHGFPVVRYGEIYTRFDMVITHAHSFIGEDAAERYTPLPSGAIIFAGSGEDPEDIGKSVLSLLDEPAYVGGDTILFAPHGADVLPRYLAYALESRPLKALKAIRSTGFTVVHISAGKLKTLPIPLPPLADQRAIADFLDRETAQIDTLIAEQQRLIDLLRERRTAVLDGIATLLVGERVKLKYLFHPSSSANQPDEQILSVYRDYGVIPKASRDDNFNRTPENVERYLLVLPGDLVVNRMKAWQGSLGISQIKGIVSGDYEVATPLTDLLLPQFTHHLLRSPRMIAKYAERSTGIRPSQWRLYWDQMGSIEIPVPPLDKQASVLARIEEQTARIDSLIVESERFIALARERRAALITAAVTGQIDVSGAAT